MPSATRTRAALAAGVVALRRARRVTKILESLPAQARGDAGPPGKDGERGPAGPRGDPGARGPQGQAGPTGSTGPQGPTGPQGLRGEQGERGETGATGKDGLSFIAGHGPPSPSVGKPGWTYLDLDTGDVWEAE